MPNDRRRSLVRFRGLRRLAEGAEQAITSHCPFVRIMVHGKDLEKATVQLPDVQPLSKALNNRGAGRRQAGARPKCMIN